MSIKFNDVVKLAAAKHILPCVRSIVFDGKSAMCVAPMDWVVGVPCLQPNITEPVVVPVAAVQAHMAKSRHLIVMPDHLTNGQGLTTPFNKPKKWDDQIVLDMLPKPPQGDTVSFELELDALDRVLIAAGETDIRYYLNGVLFDLTNGVLVGTNGHQLHMYRNRVPMAYPVKKKDGIRQGGDVELIVPRAPLRWMVSSASQAAKVTVWNPLREKLTDNLNSMPEMLLQTDDGFVWVRKPIEGKFPDWSRVLPPVLTRPVWFETDPVKLADTLGAMRRVVKLAGAGDNWGVMVDFGKGVVAGGVDCPDAGSMPFEASLHSQDASIDLPSLSEDLWVGIHPAYLQDLADCVTPAAQWRVDYLNMPNSSLLVTDGDFSGVVMPCRIGGPVKVAPVPAQDPETAQDEPVAVETTQEAPETPEAAQDAPEAQEDPETPPAEPCPAAVAALVAQLVGKAQETAKKAPRKAAKAAKSDKWPTVGEFIIKAVKDEPVAA